MDNMKKIVSVLLTITLVICSLNIGKLYVNAEVEEKQDISVTAPTEGSLVGAGYINIKFIANVENAVSYDVYFDDKLTTTYDAANGKDALCEVYTVGVSAHTAYIVAKDSSDNELKRSNIRTFYVSKKGIAMGGDMSSVVELKKLNLSWYYNWALDAFNNNVDDGIAHVPMIWGTGQDILEKLPSFQSDSNYILGFNEPDIGSQANIPVEECVEAWHYLSDTGKRTVSPALAVYTSDWFDGFFNGIELKGLDCDVIALHCYGPRIDIGSVLSAVDSAWAKYQKPIWLTEISVVGRKSLPSMDHSYEKPGEIEKMKAYLTELVEELDKRDYVERYAWFPYNIQSANDIDGMDGCGATAMFDYETGKFTELGFLYSQIGNPEGYVGATLTEEDRYVEPTTEEITSENVETTTEKRVQKPTEEPIVKPTADKADKQKPLKVKIKNARNIKKRLIAISWGKAKYAKKYQIQYALDRKFKKGKKTKTTSKLTYKIKKLKKNKKYYIRVRGVNGKMFGRWSNIKKIKIIK